MGFDILSLQRGRGPVAKSKAEEGKAVLKYIDVEDLVPSEDNFYSMSAIEELAGLIEISGGIKQPALVTPMGGGKYRVIGGHRRRRATIQLVKQGKERYRKMPCMVEVIEHGTEEGDNELRDIDEAILLITTNGQREKTDWDKVQEAMKLRELLERKRKFEKIPGETRKIIAEQLGTTPSQIGRYDSIAKHLIPEFIEKLEAGEINISVAYELSTMSECEQNKAQKLFQGKETPSIGDVKSFREEQRNSQKLKSAEPAKTELPPKEAEENKGTEEHRPSNASKSKKDVPIREREQMSRQRAGVVLGELARYCKTMIQTDRQQAELWENYHTALTVAIGKLRGE